MGEQEKEGVMYADSRNQHDPSYPVPVQDNKLMPYGTHHHIYTLPASHNKMSHVPYCEMESFVLKFSSDFLQECHLSL
jgi:hypothetical protein